MRLLQNPSGVFRKREVRIQKTGYRIIEHVDRERVTILNTEFWLLNTALAEPTKEVLQAPQYGSLLWIKPNAAVRAPTQWTHGGGRERERKAESPPRGFAAKKRGGNWK
jgi:hypothetical protein